MVIPVGLLPSAGCEGANLEVLALRFGVTATAMELGFDSGGTPHCNHAHLTRFAGPEPMSSRPGGRLSGAGTGTTSCRGAVKRG